MRIEKFTQGKGWNLDIGRGYIFRGALRDVATSQEIPIMFLKTRTRLDASSTYSEALQTLSVDSG